DRPVAHADAEAEASARELVHERRGLRVVVDVARIDDGDRRAERDALGDQRERLAQAEAVAEARAIDASVAAAFELARDVERRTAASGHGGQRDRGHAGG